MGIEAVLACLPLVLSRESEARSGSSRDFFFVRRDGCGFPGVGAGDVSLITRFGECDAFDVEFPITQEMGNSSLTCSSQKRHNYIRLSHA